MKTFLPLFLLLIIGQCQAQSGQVSGEGLKEINNLAYLSPEETVVDSLQQLNLVLPQDVDNPPLLLWIGGGAWSFVNRHMEMDLARQFAHEGIAVAAVGHRLSRGAFSPNAHPEGVQHPKHIEDVAAAFHWLKQNADKYGYDANNIYVGGFSSGGHLAALIGSDPKYLKVYGYEISDIRGIIPVAGTYDITDYHSVFKYHENESSREMAKTHVEDVFGPPVGFEDASPVSFIDQLSIPMLLISEGGLYNYTNLYETALWESEYRDCQILHVFDKDHAGLWRDISHAEESFTREVMLQFIRQHG
ncbi:MAG: alpha/beta hydrolase [Bacteroidota bacterium]